MFKFTWNSWTVLYSCMHEFTHGPPTCPVILGSNYISLTVDIFCSTWDTRIPTCLLFPSPSSFPLYRFPSFSAPPPPHCYAPSSSTCEPSQGDETHWWFIYVREAIFPSYHNLSFPLTHSHTYSSSLFLCLSVCETVCDSDAKWDVFSPVVMSWNVQVAALTSTTHTHTHTHFAVSYWAVSLSLLWVNAYDLDIWHYVLLFFF